MIKLNDGDSSMYHVQVCMYVTLPVVNKHFASDLVSSMGLLEAN